MENTDESSREGAVNGASEIVVDGMAVGSEDGFK